MPDLSDIVNAFATPTKFKNDEDFTDRLSNRYSVMLIGVFSLYIMLHSYTGDPINCFKPQHLTSNHYKYVKAYCWVKNTYYLPYGENIPKDMDENKPVHIPYYQWVPFILMGQALFFYLPSLLWNGFNQSSGVDADDIMVSAAVLNKADAKNEAGAVLLIITRQIDRFLGTRKPVKVQNKHPPGNNVEDSGHHPKRRTAAVGDTLIKFGAADQERFGCYLVILYLITKILYLANVIAQLFILNAVLAVEFSVYGIEVLRWMMDDYDWTTSPQVAFPRVTMCDFKVRRLGNVHRYTVQCTLPINLYTEKIYMFLWFWMVFVATCTAISFATWVCRVLSPTDRITYVSNHLKMLKKEFKSEAEKDKLKRFVKSYLRQDGAFLLRLIGHNTNTITVTEIIGSLWTLWSKRDDEKHDKKPDMMELKPTTAFE